MKLDNDTLSRIKPTLLSGRYCLLLGAGINRKTFNSKGDEVPSTESLRQHLVNLKGLHASSTLSRAYAQLTDEEIENHITIPTSGCTPSENIRRITSFYWRQIYTLNVDDAVENAFRDTSSKQVAESLTHRSEYRHPGDPSTVQIIHPHGWCQKPEDGYVFSLREYVQQLGPGNPWSDVLSQTLTSEPFIISGTSLQETDLEFFLHGRNQNTVRTDRGPSFLIEPYPDTGTLNDCKRYGLTLYEGTFESFLEEISKAFPSRPSPIGVDTQLKPTDFIEPVSPKTFAKFSKDFHRVFARKEPEDIDLSFYVGREPVFRDIGLERDVERIDSAPLKNRIRSLIETDSPSEHILLLSASTGTGKSTIAKRAVFDLAAEGYNIFALENIKAIDIESTKYALSRLSGKILIFVDNAADRASTVTHIYKEVVRGDIFFFCVERDYRLPQIRNAFGGMPFKEITLRALKESEAASLIDKLNVHGLGSSNREIQDSTLLAKSITGNPISIAACRILNDFKPLERIVESLRNDADLPRLERYIAAAISSYCYRQGLPFVILSSNFKSDHLQDQFNIRDVLPLTYSDPYTRDYVVPLQDILGQRVLFDTISADPELVFEVYCSLGLALSSYVNRRSIREQSPEARLGARLFDFDDVVRRLIPEHGEKFYIRMKNAWGWNSRYWEQLALLKVDKSQYQNGTKRDQTITQAISHARFAVKLENHPFCLTTLGRVLLEDIKISPANAKRSFDEAFECLKRAVLIEGKQSRIAIHPYSVLFRLIEEYTKTGGVLMREQRKVASEFAESAETLFYYEQSLLISISNTRKYFSNVPDN